MPVHTGEAWPPPCSLPTGRAAGIHVGKNRKERIDPGHSGREEKQAKEQKRRNGKGWGWVRVAMGRTVVYLDGVKKRRREASTEEKKQKRIRERRTETERWKEVEQRKRRRGETRRVRRRGRHWGRKMAQPKESTDLTLLWEKEQLIHCTINQISAGKFIGLEHL